MSRSRLARERASYVDRDAVEWPGIDDETGFRKTLWRRAYIFALYGGNWDALIGAEGGLNAIIDARVDQLVARANRRRAEQAEEYHRIIKSSRTRADEQIEEARAQDRLAEAIGEEIDERDLELEEVEETEQRLTPGQRSGRLVGKEAVAAAGATGLADAAALLLTINGLGGALPLRLFVAATLALALNVAIMAAARTAAGLWLMMGDATRDARAALVAVTLGILCFLVGGSLVSAGKFRHDALLSLDQGLPGDPRFLVWIGITAAFSAILTLAWWHYSSVGDRLVRQRREIQGERDRLEQAQDKCERLAADARRGVFKVLVDGKSARSDLDLLPEKTEHVIAEQKAEGEALRGIAKDGFATGARRAAVEGLPREPTITAKMEDSIDKAIEEILKPD